MFFLARHDSFTLTLSSNFNRKFVSQGNGTARAILRYKVFSDSIWRLLGPDFNKSLWLFFQQIKGKRQANTHGSIIRKSNTNFFDILFRKLAKKRRVKYISTLLAYQYRERGIWMRPRTDAWLLLQKMLYIEITSWLVSAYDFYSRVDYTSERSERVSL